MAIFKDSLGNVYPKHPGSGLGRGEQHSAKPTTETSMRRSSRRKSKQGKVDKHNRYRMNRGKPNGPGKPGNKSGKNKLRS